jgi:hypothetical protein
MLSHANWEKNLQQSHDLTTDADVTLLVVLDKTDRTKYPSSSQ